MILKKITTRTAILCFAITLATSCSNDTKDSKEIAEEVNEEQFDKKGEKAADHLVEAYSGNLFEIKASENAVLNATDPQVKKIAAMMVEAHSKMNTDVQVLANEKQITLPTNLTEDQSKDIEKMAEKKGIDFDKEYISTMKDKHEKTIDRLEKVADKCDDAEIKTWASTTLTDVRSHLEMVKATHENIKDRK